MDTQQEIEAIAKRLSEVIIQSIKNELDTLIPQQKDKPDLLTPKETASILGVSLPTLWRWEQKGYIKRHGMIGGKVYYSRQEISKFIR